MHSLSELRTLTLTERVPHIARLSPDEVAFLLDNHRAHIEVLPAGRRNRYRLTTLGCVGSIVAPTCRLVIRPKIPLANVFAMLDPLVPRPTASDSIAPTTGTETLDFLAGQLACCLAERVAAGLHRAYRERNEHGSILHGRLDLQAQLREAPGRKEQLHSQYDDFSVDVPCNQIVKATAESLLASSLLGADVWGELRRTLAVFESVSVVPLSPRLWDAMAMDRPPAEYRPMLELCRLLNDSLSPDGATGTTPAPSYLLDMERVFERFITRGVAEAFARSHRYSVSVQVTHAVNRPTDDPDVTVRPDLTIDRDGKAVTIVDAKWKRLPRNLVTTDLYQILAYGTTLGVESVALVYPGRKWRVREIRFIHTPLRLTVYTLAVGGRRESCTRSVRWLARALLRAV